MSEKKDWGRWRDYRAMQFASIDDHSLAPCVTCGRPYSVGPYPIKRILDDVRCDACWEVEQRLATYLRDGGAKAHDFVLTALIESEREPKAPPNVVRPPPRRRSRRPA
jgi:hypothetical protein